MKKELVLVIVAAMVIACSTHRKATHVSKVMTNMTDSLMFENSVYSAIYRDVVGCATADSVEVVYEADSVLMADGKRVFAPSVIKRVYAPRKSVAVSDTSHTSRQMEAGLSRHTIVS